MIKGFARWYRFLRTRVRSDLNQYTKVTTNSLSAKFIVKKLYMECSEKAIPFDVGTASVAR